MLQLRKLIVHRFRRVRPETQLLFDEKWNVLLGKNASGKTTLLKLIAACLRADFKEFSGDDFDLEYEMVAGDLLLKCRAENWPSRAVSIGSSVPNAEAELLAAQGDSAEGVLFSVTIARLNSGDAYTVRVGPYKMELAYPEQRVLDVPPRMISSQLLVAVLFALARYSKEFADKFNLVTALTALLSAPPRFDEALEMFDALLDPKTRLREVVSHSEDGKPQKTWSVIEGSSMLFSALVQLFWTHDTRPEGDRIVFSPKHIPFIKDLIDFFGFSDATLNLQLTQREITEDGSRTHWGPFFFVFSSADGTVLRHDLLSFGQRRLLAFVIHLAIAKHVVVADELVNGLHHSWIRQCLDQMGDRQKFLTSQNPLLLDFLPFRSADEVAGRFIKCSCSDGSMLWSNLERPEAESFFRSFSAGMLHVGEILRMKGLW